MNKASVVILNWNGKNLLELFLDRAIRHSSSEAYTVIVADNGSTDDSCEYIRKKHPGVTLIELGQNYGFAGGYNEALSRLESEYFILLNSDVEVSPGWINPVIEYMDTHPEVAACQPKILSYNDRSRFEYAGAAGGFIDKYGYPFCRGRLLNITEKDEGQYNDIRQVFWASGACLFIRSSDWKEAGGFDPDFFAHMEEIDLCWRLNAGGKKIMCVPSSTVYHFGGGSLPYKSPSKIFYNFRNNLFMLYKNLPQDRLKKILFIRMCLDGIAALRFLLSLNFTAFVNVIKAHLHYYRHKKELKLKREEGIKDKISYPQDLILNKSLVFNFYIKRVKTYSQLTGQ
ncbi:MAG: glycosyltransferase family 2 protein [Bacteroidales bacterium]|nr:glycosyltransferase family 2 protein [Bacteroidales bacterium]